MIKIENVCVNGWEAAIRGMRNPHNSWDKSDSIMDEIGLVEIGPNDLDLMKRLTKAGTDHRKFLRMINVTMDITAPLYWWKEFDTYKVGTVRNSCSTMHTIHVDEFCVHDFSYEKMNCDAFCELERIITILNGLRADFYSSGRKKEYWYSIIQLLPSSYNQRATVQLNYEVLLNMYFSRGNHRLDEWVRFCEWIESLPYMKELIESATVTACRA